MSNKVDFLHADKHESSQNSKFAIISKKKSEMKLNQSSPRFDFNTLGIKVSYNITYKVILLSMDMIKHSQSTQSNKFAISLQCLKQEVL